MEVISEQLIASKFSDLPSWENSDLSQKKEILKSESLEFTGFIPVIPILFHLCVVVNISSDCDELNTGLIWTYLVLLHVLTFTFEVVYYLPFNSNKTTTQIKFVLLKSLLLTFNLFVFTLIRAKPYKCITNFNPVVSIVLLIFAVTLNGIFSVVINSFKVRYLNEFEV